jgi:hypothetical protein
VPYRTPIWIEKRFGTEAIRNHDCLDAEVLHPVLHVAADRRYRRSRFQTMPINAIKSEYIVRVPQDIDAIAKTYLS